MSIPFVHWTLITYMFDIPDLYPTLQQFLADTQDWRNREAAVMALGAVAAGINVDINKQLPVLLPYVAQMLSDKHWPVRSICCWTLSRYSKWIAAQEVL